MKIVSPKTGRTKGCSICFEQTYTPPPLWIATLHQGTDGEWKFFNKVGDCYPLSASDLRIILERVEQLNGQATEERLKKARKTAH